jgi:hypothetical protein
MSQRSRSSAPQAGAGRIRRRSRRGAGTIVRGARGASPRPVCCVRTSRWSGGPPGPEGRGRARDRTGQPRAACGLVRLPSAAPAPCARRAGHRAGAGQGGARRRGRGPARGGSGSRPAAPSRRWRCWSARSGRASRPDDLSDSRRAEQLKRLDGIATILARAAAREGSLLALLAEDAPPLHETRSLLREMRRAAGMDVTEESEDPARGDPHLRDDGGARAAGRPPVGHLAPAREPVPGAGLLGPAPAPKPRLLATWELLNPLLRAFEEASGGASSCMRLPEPTSLQAAAGRELMPHQAQVVAAAAAGAPHLPAGRRARASARRRRRCSPPRRQGPTRCSSWSRTS